MPRPIHQPVEVWQPLVSGNPRGIDFMAKMGIRPLIANNPEKTLAERLKLYQEALHNHGQETELGRTRPSDTVSSSRKPKRRRWSCPALTSRRR